MSSRPGINVVGFVSGNLGIGVVARQLVKTLVARGHPVAVLDLDPGYGRVGFDMSAAEHFVAAESDLPYDINVWVVGADQLVPRARHVCGSPHLQGRFNAMYVWWELPHVPAHWVAAARVFDALIAGSEFVQEALRNAVPGLPVLLAGTPVVLPDGVMPTRARFGLPSDGFLAFLGFEPASDPERKNPFAGIHAFKSAFANQPDARLVIKLNNAGAESRAQDRVKQLEQLAAEDARLVLIKDRLPYDELLGLYAVCDVVISLHRSEGLGLIPLEAMRLGRPAVATGWSGNMTYMSHANSALVRFSFRATDDNSMHYSPQSTGMHSFWAEPDLEHAAALLRWLANDRQALADLSAAAVRDSAEYNRRALRADFIDEVVALHARRHLLPDHDFKVSLARISSAVADLDWRRKTPMGRLAARLRWRAQALFRTFGRLGQAR